MTGHQHKGFSADPRSRIWISLITRASYLPGLTLLVHTIYEHGSKHPFLVQYTASLTEDCIQCLERLTDIYPLLKLQEVDPILLPKGSGSVAKRFDDTLTKLRAFQPLEDPRVLAETGLERPPEQACFLDADIMIFRNMDDIFDTPRPGPDWIAAHHACVCNRDNDPWAGPDWKPENCAMSIRRHPEALTTATPSSSKDGARRTHQLLNSGVFVFTPSRQLWNRIEHFRQTDPQVKDFRFPDQNFLDVFFHDRWVPISWKYNALKTQRYWHPESFRDEEVRALHYIVDKPWEKRIGKDGVAGYLGRDGVTHAWWWEAWEKWRDWMRVNEASDVVTCVEQYVAPENPQEKGTEAVANL